VYRIGFMLVMVLALALGVVAGVLNPQTVSVDLLLIQVAWPLGLILICMLVLGALLGFLLTAMFSVWPLKIRLRRSEKLAAGKTSASSVAMENQDA
jgi:uncharacterized integral membrane protein